MASSVTTAQIGQYYPTLQPLLSQIQDMVPAGQSTNDQQNQALAQIANQYTSENAQFKGQLASTLNDQVGKYVDLSHRLNDYNEIYNTNAYIDQELSREERELARTTNKLKNSIFVSKQRAMMYEYQREKTNYYKVLVLISCFMAVDLINLSGLNINGRIGDKYMYIYIAISVAIYLAVVGLFTYSNSFRSNTDWNKYNWSNVGSSQATASCPGTAAATDPTTVVAPV